MINHARTLLLNLPANEIDIYEEYISPEFRPLALKGSLRETYNTIFGKSTKRWEKNYRARELMTILHSGDYEKHVLELDPRITYLPFEPKPTDKQSELPPLHELPNKLFLSGKFDYLTKSPLFADRLSGLTLEFIYKLEELRREMEGHQVLVVD